MCTTLEWIERTDLFQDPPSKSPVHPGTVYMRLQRPVSGNPPKKKKHKVLRGNTAPVGVPGQIRGLRGIKEC